MINLSDPEQAAGECFTQSANLRVFLHERGLEAKILRCEGYQGDFSQAAQMWQRTLSESEVRERFGHYVVRLGDFVIDLTAAQLGQARPVVMPYTDFQASWSHLQEL